MTDAQTRQDQLAEQLRRLVEVATDPITGDMGSALDAAHPVLLAAWVQAFGGVEALPADTADLAAYVVLVRAALTDALHIDRVDVASVAGAWRLAYGMGLDHAQLTAWWDPTTTVGARQAPLFPLASVVEDQLARTLNGVEAQALGARGFVAVQEALASGRHTVTRVNAATAYEVTAAAATAVRDVAAEKGATVLWVAERDGCLHCLAYAGETTTTVFPPGLTFGDRGLEPHGPMVGPPLHPWCRCSLEILHPSDTAVVDSLKREARRSVLRGDALDSEPARLRAADRLLARGAGLPKTVEARAERAVTRGSFDRRDQGNG